MGLGKEPLADELPVWFGAKRTGETRVCRNRASKCWPGVPIVSVLGRGVASLLQYIIISTLLYYIKLTLLYVLHKILFFSLISLFLLVKFHSPWMMGSTKSQLLSYLKS